jgi:hypothetical protein
MAVGWGVQYASVVSIGNQGHIHSSIQTVP